MNEKELDILWFKAMHQSVEENKPFVRYHFAALVAEREREACAKENAELLQALQNLHQRCHWSDAPEEMDAAKAVIEKAIRARGET